MMNICTFLCFMACAFVLAACSDSDEDVIVQGGLTGNWYSSFAVNIRIVICPQRNFSTDCRVSV